MLPKTQKWPSLSLEMKIGATSHIGGRWPHTHMYREDGNRNTQVQAFLNGGSSPPRLDVDAPSITAMAVVAVAEAAETYRSLERWVSSIGTGKMLIPSFVVRSYQRGAELPKRVG
jgi:hypothetical protein